MTGIFGQPQQGTEKILFTMKGSKKEVIFWTLSRFLWQAEGKKGYVYRSRGRS
jgi:hypothetical protein